MTNYQKAIREAEKMIKKETNWKNKHGYRENLGYDKWNKLQDIIAPLNLHYTEKCDVKQFFFEECDKI